MNHGVELVERVQTLFDTLGEADPRRAELSIVYNYRLRNPQGLEILAPLEAAEAVLYKIESDLRYLDFYRFLLQSEPANKASNPANEKVKINYQMSIIKK